MRPRAHALGLLAALLATRSNPVDAEGGGDLTIEIEARVVKTAEAELGRIERLLRAQPGIQPQTVANVTLPLQAALEEDLGRGPVKIYPRAIYDACLERAKQGLSIAVIGRQLVELHRKGDLARGPASPVNEATVKKVASFVFDKERLRSPDPHLPPSFSAAPGEKVKGLYQICVGVDGKVVKVTAVQSIPGADQAVMEQIRSTWLYKPQPVPVCTTRAFVFQFN